MPPDPATRSEVLALGLQQWRVRQALEAYRQGELIVRQPALTPLLLDRLIAEIIALRQQVVALSNTSTSPQVSVRQAEYFGMWADREDMQDRSSRAWLEDLRGRQWTR